MVMIVVRLRDFVLDFTNTLVSLLRILVLSKRVQKIKVETSFKEAVVLGNGPSLNQFLAEKSSFLDDKFKVCVNYFCRTKEFQALKPNLYVISSPEYFVKEEKKEFAVERAATLQSIADRTIWPMTFVVPALAKSYPEWKTIFHKHPHIKIAYMNTSPVEGFNRFKFWAYSANIGMPRPHNVLIPCILTAINQRFSTIYIAGADHSWMKEIVVDDTNEVLLSQKHFYDKQAALQTQYRDMAVPQPMYVGATTQKRKLHEVIEKFYQTFKSYWVLEDYAKKKGVKIFNITPNSFIDAFEKKQL